MLDDKGDKLYIYTYITYSINVAGIYPSWDNVILIDKKKIWSRYFLKRTSDSEPFLRINHVRNEKIK